MLVTARRLVSALAPVVALSVVPGACARHGEAPPPVVDAAPDRPAAAVPRDAAVERPFDGPPDTAGPARARGPRSAPPPRAAAADGFHVEGSLGKADARTVLRGARASLAACYEKAHAQNPALAGRVSFRLSIDGRGRVPLAEVVSSTLGGGDPELCMVEALRDLRFPHAATGGESTLRFPMTFGRPAGDRSD
jgi:hypothetical protein